MRLTPDANCLIAAVCAWHEHHGPTAAEFAARKAARDEIVIAAPALVEAYAVLTRLPPPHRLGPSDAHQLLDSNWGRSESVSLTAQEYWRFLARCRDDGIGGGMTYDALIAACARKGRVELLLTWNIEHFKRFRAGFDVCAPGQ